METKLLDNTRLAVVRIGVVRVLCLFVCCIGNRVGYVDVSVRDGICPGCFHVRRMLGENLRGVFQVLLNHRRCERCNLHLGAQSLKRLNETNGCRFGTRLEQVECLVSVWWNL